MNQYDDILHLPHFVSKNHKPMSNINRAAQFTPFSALAGHEEAVIETARKTNEKIILDDSKIEMLNQKLQQINENLPMNSPISITYFKQDERKEGGNYITIFSIIKKIDVIQQVLILEDKKIIKFIDIYSIEDL